MPITNANGIELYYEVHGEGEPLLLIMGLAHNLLSWKKSLPALAEQFKVIIFDNRGTGRSCKPETPYTIELMADEAKAVLDAAGVEKAHVYGISMGGMIAQRLALNYPERIKSLILGCTSPGGINQVAPDGDVIMTLLSGAIHSNYTTRSGMGICSHTLQHILHRKPSRFHCRAHRNNDRDSNTGTWVYAAASSMPCP